MGLDQNLYRTTKKRKAAFERFDELCKEYGLCRIEMDNEDRWKDLFNGLPQNDEKTMYLAEKFTEEQKKALELYKEEVKKVAEKVGVRISEELIPQFIPSDFGLTEEDEDEELMYWRKNWELHNFIVQNFGNPEDDNLVRIWLDKDAIDKIIEAGFDVDVFKRAKMGIDEDHVLYYWPWY